jgi:hypothetical protein
LTNFFKRNQTVYMRCNGGILCWLCECQLQWFTPLAGAGGIFCTSIHIVPGACF